MTTTVKSDAPKLPYATPRVTAYGSVQELAKNTTTPGATDGGVNPNMYAS